jgi:hypothetical protein
MKLAKDSKDVTGARKISLSQIPTTALAHLSIALQHGNSKHHGWQGKKVKASTYIDAILRHVFAFAEGEDLDPESSMHHLGAVMGNCSILLDAIEVGNFADDRRKSTVTAKDIYERWQRVHKSTAG